MNVTKLSRALFVVMATHTSIAAAQSSPLTGAWERVSLRDSAGTIIQPPAAVAFAIYSANGYFSQIAIPTGRAVSDKRVDDMTREELAARFQGVSAVRGTYAISGNRLTRRALASLNPAQEGQDVVQTFRVEGDTLILGSPNPASRAEAKFVRAR
jgi:hypothetical protein